jgi:hypothetical protein
LKSASAPGDSPVSKERHRSLPPHYGRPLSTDQAGVGAFVQSAY